jgi:hypothetical protein
VTRQRSTTVPHPLVNALASGDLRREIPQDPPTPRETECDCGTAADVTGVCERCQFLDDLRWRVWRHAKTGRVVTVPLSNLEIVTWLRHNPDSTLAEIADGLSSSHRAVHHALQTLISRGRVKSWEDSVEFVRNIRHHTKTKKPMAIPAYTSLMRYRLTS